MTALHTLREKAMKATPGPWAYDDYNGDFLDAGGHLLDLDKSAAFIAAANPSTILSLLDRIEKLEGALQAYHDANRLHHDADAALYELSSQALRSEKP